jgi:hypothetical protein
MYAHPVASRRCPIALLLSALAGTAFADSEYAIYRVHEETLVRSGTFVLDADYVAFSMSADGGHILAQECERDGIKLQDGSSRTAIIDRTGDATVVTWTSEPLHRQFVWDDEQTRWLGFTGDDALVSVQVEDGEVSVTEMKAAPLFPWDWIEILDLESPGLFGVVYHDQFSTSEVEILDCRGESAEVIRNWESPVSGVFQTILSRDELAGTFEKGAGGLAQLWNVEDGEALGAFQSGVSLDRFPQFDDIDLSTDGTMIAGLTAMADGAAIEVWYTADASRVLNLEIEDIFVGQIAFSEDGEYLWFWNHDGHLRVWQCSDWQEAAHFLVPDDFYFGPGAIDRRPWLILNGSTPPEAIPLE